MEDVMNETPTQAMAKAETAFHIDARGRRIEVRRLNALQFYKASKAIGDTSGTAAELAMLACAVTKIDTQMMALPTRESDIQFVIQQLDFDGLAAAGEALGKLGAETNDDSRVAEKN
jgi:hypothetical protein